VAAASSPKAVGVAFVAGVPTATTTASALRVRVGRLLDPRRDRGARLASATSLVSVTALALAVVVSTQLAPAVMFLEAVVVSAPAAAVPAIEVRRAPAPRAKVDAAAWGLERPQQRHLSRRVTRPIESGPPEAAVHPFAGTHVTVEAPSTVPLDSRVIAADAIAPVLAASLPSSPPAGIASAPTPVAPWDAVGASTASAASGAARAAVATGARARSAGVSIGRFFTRAGTAVATDSQPR